LGAIPEHETVKGALKLENVLFRYAGSEEFILKSVNLAVEPGEFIVLMGPSGAGKSSLMKILACLEQPVSGAYRIDGIRVEAQRMLHFRKHIGAVMQDDELFAGSIFDNVTAHDPVPDNERCVNVLVMAGAYEETMRFPMGMETLLGDRGSSISGGQKQRILLARALYKQPAILLLDEATANIDMSAEANIYSNLKTLAATKIIVSHRPEALKYADRAFFLMDATLVPMERKLELAA
jgi:ATP-binding cassette subfamily B protein RaxB